MYTSGCSNTVIGKILLTHEVSLSGFIFRYAHHSDKNVKIVCMFLLPWIAHKAFNILSSYFNV